MSSTFLLINYPVPSNYPKLNTMSTHKPYLDFKYDNHTLKHHINLHEMSISLYPVFPIKFSNNNDFKHFISVVALFVWFGFCMDLLLKQIFMDII